jgi:energy-coupling factor transport system permease protein
MNTEIYLDRDTFFHRLDPRTKIIIFLLTFVAILLFNDPLWMLPLAAIILLELLISGAIVNMKRIWFILLVLTLTGLIMWPLFTKGTTPFFWILTVEQVKYAIARDILVILMISAGMLLISTTRNEELILGMQKLGLPYRVGFAISTAIRLVPTIADSFQTIGQAQRSRGLDIDSGSILQRLKKYLPVLVPVFISSIRNANIFGMALEAKGFGARKKRMSYLQIHMKKDDFLVLILAVLFVFTSIYLYANGYGHLAGLIR